MKTIIEQLCNTNELVEIYTNRDDFDKFGVGYVVACTENDYLVHTFDDKDLDDGYYVMHRDSIFVIQRNTKYLKNMLQIIKPKPDKFKLPKGSGLELDLFGEVLLLCQKKRLIVVVRLECDMECYGWVTDFNDNVIEIELVDGDGMFDGTAYLRMEDVQLIGFGGQEENRRAKLVHRNCCQVK